MPSDGRPLEIVVETLSVIDTTWNYTVIILPVGSPAVTYPPWTASQTAIADVLTYKVTVNAAVPYFRVWFGTSASNEAYVQRSSNNTILWAHNGAIAQYDIVIPSANGFGERNLVFDFLTPQGKIPSVLVKVKGLDAFACFPSSGRVAAGRQIFARVSGATGSERLVFSSDLQVTLSDSSVVTQANPVDTSPSGGVTDLTYTTSSGKDSLVVTYRLLPSVDFSATPLTVGTCSYAVLAADVQCSPARIRKSFAASNTTCVITKPSGSGLADLQTSDFGAGDVVDASIGSLSAVTAAGTQRWTQVFLGSAAGATSFGPTWSPAVLVASQQSQNLIPASRYAVDVLAVASVVYSKYRVALGQLIQVTVQSAAGIAIHASDFAGDIDLAVASPTASADTVQFFVNQTKLISKPSPLAKLRWATEFGSSDIVAPNGTVIAFGSGSYVQTADASVCCAATRFFSVLVNYLPDSTGAYPTFLASDLTSSVSGATTTIAEERAPAASGNAYGVTFRVPVQAPLTYSLSWNPSTILASGVVYSFTPTIIMLQLTCPANAAKGTTPYVLYPDEGTFSPYTLVSPGVYSFTFTKTDLGTSASAIRIDFASSYLQTLSTSGDRKVLAATYTTQFVSTVLSCPRTRLHALGGTATCYIDKDTSSSGIPNTDVFNISSSDPSRVSITAITLVNANRLSFQLTVAAEAPVGNVSISAHYQNLEAVNLQDAIVIGSPLTVTLLRGSLACDRARIALGTSVDCQISTWPGSMALALSDFVAAATVPGGNQNINGSLGFTASPSTGNPTTISASFFTGGPALTTTVLVVEALQVPRPIVDGCTTTCTIPKAASSPDLLVSDLALAAPSPAFGSVSGLSASGGGALQFTYTGALGAPTGVTLGFTYGTSIDPASSVSTSALQQAVFSLSSLGTLMCGVPSTKAFPYGSFKMLKGVSYTCSIAPINGSATLTTADLTFPISTTGATATFSSLAADSSTGGLSFSVEPTSAGSSSWAFELAACGTLETVSIDLIDKPVLSCPAVSAIGAKVACTVNGTSAGPGFSSSWLGAPFVQAPDAGIFTGYSLKAANVYYFNFTNTNGTSATVYIDFAKSLINTTTTDVNGTATAASIRIGSASLSYVSASVSCSRTTILAAARAACFLNKTASSAAFPSADVFSITSSNASRASIGAVSLVDGTNGAVATFDVIAANNAPVSTITVSAQFANMGGYDLNSAAITGSPITISLTRPVVNGTLSCQRSRINAVGGRSLCVINKTETSAKFPASSLFAVTSSATSSATIGPITIVDDGNAATFEVIGVSTGSASSVTITAAFTDLEALVLQSAGISGSASITLLRATVACTPSRMVFGRNTTCTVSGTGLQSADLASASVGSAAATLAGLSFTLPPALGNSTVTVDFASGGTGPTTTVAAIQVQSLTCNKTRLQTGCSTLCNLNPATGSPALLTTDATVSGNPTLSAVDGGLQFTYTGNRAVFFDHRAFSLELAAGSLGGGDAGANLTFAYTASVDGTSVSTSSIYANIVTLSATLQCGLPLSSDFKLLRSNAYTPSSPPPYTCVLSKAAGSGSLAVSDLTTLSATGAATTLSGVVVNGNGGLNFSATPTVGGTATWTLTLQTCSSPLITKTVDVIGPIQMSCHNVTAVGAKIRCTLNATEPSAAYGTSLGAPYVESPEAGTFSALTSVGTANAAGIGEAHYFDFEATSFLGTATVKLDFLQTVIQTIANNTASKLLVASSKITYIAATVSCAQTSVNASAGATVCFLNKTAASAAFPSTSFFMPIINHPGRLTVGPVTITPGTNSTSAYFTLRAADYPNPVGTYSISVAYTGLSGVNLAPANVSGGPFAIQFTRPSVGAAVNCVSTRVHLRGGSIRCYINATGTAFPSQATLSTNVLFTVSYNGGFSLSSTMSAITYVSGSNWRAATFVLYGYGSGGVGGVVNVTVDYNAAVLGPGFFNDIDTTPIVNSPLEISVLDAQFTCDGRRIALTKTLSCNITARESSPAILLSDLVPGSISALVPNISPELWAENLRCGRINNTAPNQGLFTNFRLLHNALQPIQYDCVVDKAAGSATLLASDLYRSIQTEIYPGSNTYYAMLGSVEQSSSPGPIGLKWKITPTSTGVRPWALYFTHDVSTCGRPFDTRNVQYISVSLICPSIVYAPNDTGHCNITAQGIEPPLLPSFFSTSSDRVAEFGSILPADENSTILTFSFRTISTEPPSSTDPYAPRGFIRLELDNAQILVPEGYTEFYTRANLFSVYITGISCDRYVTINYEKISCTLFKSTHSSLLSHTDFTTVVTNNTVPSGYVSNVVYYSGGDSVGAVFHTYASGLGLVEQTWYYKRTGEQILTPQTFSIIGAELRCDRSRVARGDRTNCWIQALPNSAPLHNSYFNLVEPYRYLTGSSTASTWTNQDTWCEAGTCAGGYWQCPPGIPNQQRFDEKFDGGSIAIDSVSRVPQFDFGTGGNKSIEIPILFGVPYRYPVSSLRIWWSADVTGPESTDYYQDKMISVSVDVADVDATAVVCSPQSDRSWLGSSSAFETTCAIKKRATSSLTPTGGMNLSIPWNSTFSTSVIAPITFRIVDATVSTASCLTDRTILVANSPVNCTISSDFVNWDSSSANPDDKDFVAYVGDNLAISTSSIGTGGNPVTFTVMPLQGRDSTQTVSVGFRNADGSSVGREIWRGTVKGIADYNIQCGNVNFLYGDAASVGSARHADGYYRIPVGTSATCTLTAFDQSPRLAASNFEYDEPASPAGATSALVGVGTASASANVDGTAFCTTDCFQSFAFDHVAPGLPSAPSTEFGIRIKYDTGLDKAVSGYARVEGTRVKQARFNFSYIGVASYSCLPPILAYGYRGVCSVDLLANTDAVSVADRRDSDAPGLYDLLSAAPAGIRVEWPKVNGTFTSNPVAIVTVEPTYSRSAFDIFLQYNKPQINITSSTNTIQVVDAEITLPASYSALSQAFTSLKYGYPLNPYTRRLAIPLGESFWFQICAKPYSAEITPASHLVFTWGPSNSLSHVVEATPFSGGACIVVNITAIAPTPASIDYLTPLKVDAGFGLLPDRTQSTCSPSANEYSSNLDDLAAGGYEVFKAGWNTSLTSGGNSPASYSTYPLLIGATPTAVAYGTAELVGTDSALAPSTAISQFRRSSVRGRPVCLRSFPLLTPLVFARQAFFGGFNYKVIPRVSATVVFDPARSVPGAWVKATLTPADGAGFLSFSDFNLLAPFIYKEKLNSATGKYRAWSAGAGGSLTLFLEVASGAATAQPLNLAYKFYDATPLSLRRRTLASTAQLSLTSTLAILSIHSVTCPSMTASGKCRVPAPAWRQICPPLQGCYNINADYSLYAEDFFMASSAGVAFSGIRNTTDKAGAIEVDATIANTSLPATASIRAMWSQSIVGPAGSVANLGSPESVITIVDARIWCPSAIFKYGGLSITCMLLSTNGASLLKSDFDTAASDFITSNASLTISNGNSAYDGGYGRVNFTVSGFSTLATGATFSLRARYSEYTVEGALNMYTEFYTFGPTTDFNLTCSSLTVRYKQTTTCTVTQTAGFTVDSSYFYPAIVVDASGNELSRATVLNCTGYTDTAVGKFQFTCQSNALERAAGTFIRVAWRGSEGGYLPQVAVRLVLPITTFACTPTRVAVGDIVYCLLASPDAPLPLSIIYGQTAVPSAPLNPNMTTSNSITWYSGWAVGAGGTLSINGTAAIASRVEGATAQLGIESPIKYSPAATVDMVQVQNITCSPGTRVALGATVSCVVHPKATSPSLLTTDLAFNRTDCRPSNYSGSPTFSSYTSLAAGAAGTLTFTFTAASISGEDATTLAGCVVPIVYQPAISASRSLAASTSFVTVAASVTCPPATTIFKYGSILCTLVPTTATGLTIGDFTESTPVTSNVSVSIGALTLWSPGRLNFTVGAFTTINDGSFSLKAQYSTNVTSATTYTSTYGFGPAIDFTYSCTPALLAYNHTSECTLAQRVGAALPNTSSSNFLSPVLTDSSALLCTSYVDTADGRFRFSCRSVVVDRPVPMSVTLTWRGPGGGSLPVVNLTLSTPTSLSCTPARVAVGDAISCTLSGASQLYTAMTTAAKVVTSTTSSLSGLTAWTVVGSNLVINATVSAASKNETIRAALIEGRQSGAAFLEFVQVDNVTCTPGARVALGSSVTCHVYPKPASPALRTTDLQLNRTNCGASASTFGSLAVGSAQEGTLSFTFSASSLAGDDATASGCALPVLYGSSISALRSTAATVTLKTISAKISCDSPIFKYGTATCTLAPETATDLRLDDFAASPISSNKTVTLGDLYAWPPGRFNFSVGAFTTIGSASFSLKAQYSTNVTSATTYTSTYGFGPALDFSLACTPTSVIYDEATVCVVQQLTGSPSVSSSSFLAARVLDGATMNCGAYTDITAGKFNFSCVSKVSESANPGSIVVGWKGNGGGILPYFNVTLFKIVSEISCSPSRVAVGDNTTCTLTANIAIAPKIAAGIVTSTPGSLSLVGPWRQSGNDIAATATVLMPSRNETVEASLQGGGKSAPDFLSLVQVDSISCVPGTRVARSVKANCTVVRKTASPDLLTTDLALNHTTCASGSSSFTAFSGLRDGPASSGDLMFTFTASQLVGTGGCGQTLYYSSAIASARGVAATVSLSVVSVRFECPTIIYRFGTLSDFDAVPIVTNTSLTVGSLTAYPAGRGFTFTLEGFDAVGDNATEIQAVYSQAVAGDALRSPAAVFGPSLDFVLNCTLAEVAFNQTTECKIKQRVGRPLLNSSYFDAAGVVDGGSMACGPYTDIAAGEIAFSCVSKRVNRLSPAQIRVNWKDPAGGQLATFPVVLRTVSALSCLPARIAVGDKLTCTLSANYPITPGFTRSASSLVSGGVLSNVGVWTQSGENLVITATASTAARNASITAELIEAVAGNVPVSPPSFVEIVAVDSITCSPGTRVLLNTAANCTVNRQADSPDLLLSDLVLNRTLCGGAGSANFTALALGEGGNLVFTFHANSLVGGDSAGCALPILYASNISALGSTAATATFLVIDRYTNFTCASRAMRWARPATFDCVLQADSADASSPVRTEDLVLLAPAGVAFTRSSLTLTLSHEFTADAVYSFQFVWAPSVVQPDFYGTLNISAVYQVDIVATSLSCTNTGNRIPGTTMSCTLSRAADSVSLVPEDVSIAVFRTGNASVPAVAAGGDLTFTYTPPDVATTPLLGDMVTVSYANTIDRDTNLVGNKASGDPSNSRAIFYVAADLNCPTSRLRLGASTTCTLTVRPGWSVPVLSDLADYEVFQLYLVLCVYKFNRLRPQVTGDDLLNAYGSIPVTGSTLTSITFTATNAGLKSTIKVYYSSSVSSVRTALDTSFDLTVIATRATNPVTCDKTRIAVQGVARCTLWKSDSSAPFTGEDFVDQYLSPASARNPVVTAGNLEFDFETTLANGPMFTYTLSYVASIGGGFAGSTNISIIKADLHCSPQRRGPNTTFSCSVTPTATSAPLLLSDIAAPSTNSSMMILGPARVSAKNSSILVFEGNTIDATTASIYLSYSTEMGGAPLGAFVMAVVGARLNCNPRVRAGSRIQCQILRAPDSPALTTSDVFVAVYRIGYRQLSNRRAFSQSGDHLQTTLRIPPAPLTGEVGHVSVNYGGGSLGTFYPIATLNSNFTVVWGTLTCKQPRRRVNSIERCLVNRAAISSPLEPTDIDVPTMRGQISDPTVPVVNNGSLEINVTMSTYGTVSLSTFWSASVDADKEQIPSTVNVTVLDGRASCSPSRIAVGANVSCVVLPNAGSADLLVEDVKPAPVPGGYISTGDLVPVNGSITFSALAVTAKDAVPVSVSWSDGLDGGELAAQLVDVVRADFACLQRARESLAAPCTLTPVGQSPALLGSDFYAPVPSKAGAFSGYAAGDSGIQAFTFATAALVPSVSLSISYNASIQPSLPDLQADGSPQTIIFVGGVLSTNTSRVAVGTTAHVFIAKKENSSTLALSDFDDPSFSPLLTEGAAAISRGTTDSGLAYAYTMTVPGRTVALANFSSSVGGGPVVMDVDPAITVLGANLTCSSRRVAVGTAIECHIALIGDSPKLSPDELVVSVTPSAAVTNDSPALANATDSAFLYSFVVNVVAPTADASISFVAIGADMTCSHNRLRVGAISTCDIAKRTDSPDLLLSDFTLVNNSAGSYGAASTTAGGGLSFDYTSEAVTDDNGATILVRYAPALDEAASVIGGGNVTVVIIDVSAACDLYRAALAVSFNCTLTRVDGSAAISAADFGAASVDPAATAALSSWTATGSETDPELYVTVTTAAAATNATLTFPWASAVGGGSKTTLLNVVAGNVTCDRLRLALNATTRCTIGRVGSSPALDVADFLALAASPADLGEFSALSAADGGTVAFTYRALLPTTEQTAFIVKYAAAVDPSQRDVNPTSVSVVVLSASLVCTPDRRAINAPFSCSLSSRNDTWPTLLPEDFAAPAISPAGATFTPLVSAGDAVNFTVAATVQSLYPNLTVSWSSAAHDLADVPAVAPYPLTVLSANVSCTGLRQTLGHTISCTITSLDLSPCLLMQELAVDVQPAGVATLSSLSSRGPAAQCLFLGENDTDTGMYAFTVTSTNLTDSGKIVVRYASAIDPSTAVVQEVPFVVVGADLACTDLRRRLGASVSCELKKQGGGPDLLASDFELLPCSAGTYGSVTPTASGGLQFQLTATATTPDDGAPLAVRFAALADANQTQLAAFNVVVIAANFSCSKPRIAVQSPFNCSAFAPLPGNSTATLSPSDFAAPVLVPAGSFVADQSGWFVHGTNELYHRFTSATPGAAAVVWLSWAASVGGGSTEVLVDVIEARLVCTTPRRAVNVSAPCLLARVGDSPALQLADFLQPGASPAGFGVFGALAVEADGNVSLSYTPLRLTPTTVLSVQYSFAVDDSVAAVTDSGFNLATLGAQISCPARRAIGATLSCTVSAATDSAPLQDGDLIAASYSPSGTVSNVSAPAFAGPSALVTAVIASTVTNVTVVPRWSAAVSTDSHASMTGIAASVAVVDATLVCGGVEVEIGGTLSCSIQAVSPSVIQFSDFQGPVLDATSLVRRNVLQQFDFADVSALAVDDSGRIALTITGRRLTEQAIARVSVSYATAVDPSGSSRLIREAPRRFQVTGAMRVVSSRFLDNAFQIQIVFTAPGAASGNTEAFPSGNYFTADGVILLGEGATCAWTAPAVLTCDSTANATIMPGDRLVFRAPVVSSDGTGRSFSGFVIIGPPLNPPVPAINIDYVPSVGSCRLVKVKVVRVSGVALRGARIRWACADNATCDLSTRVQEGIDAANRGNSAQLSISSQIPTEQTYTFSISASNFLGVTSSVVVSVFKSAGLPPTLQIDGGSTVYTRTPDLTTIKVIALRTQCETDDPAFFVVQQDDFRWFRSEGIDVAWLPPSSLQALLPASVALDKPAITIPRGTLPPGEVYTLTMAAVDTLQQPPTRASINVTVIVARQPVDAIIAGGDHVVSPFSTFTAVGTLSHDPDYTPGRSAAGTSSVLFFTWIFTGADGLPVHRTQRTTDSVLSITPADAGLKQKTAYTLTLLVEAERSGVAAEFLYANDTASISVQVASASTPIVKITDVFPADLLYVTKYPIQIRCSAIQPGNAKSDSEMRFVWSAPGGERELANLSSVTSRSTLGAHSISTIFITEEFGLHRDRLYGIRCSAYNEASGAESAGSEQISVRVISGPKPGECAVVPSSGVALETQFVVTCSGWNAAYSEDASLRYQLKV
eukprot:tig00020603_g11772.t1